jgi:hypothetical protein
MTNQNCPIKNVSETERLVAGILGVALLASSLRISKPFRFLGAALLFYRAFTGNCKGYELLGINLAEPSAHDSK